MKKMNTTFKNTLILAALLLVAMCVGSYLYLTKDITLNTEDQFEPFDISLEEYQLYDMGVANINNDELLDVYTINHSAQQSLLVNDGTGAFAQRIQSSGLSQDYTYAGAEDSDKKPDIKKPGIYVYRYERNLYIKSHLLNSNVSGSVSLPWGIKVIKQEKTQTEISKQEIQNKVASETLAFTIQPKGTLVINGKEDIVELPHSFNFDGVEPESIYLGLHSTPAKSEYFTLDWRDRHSMAWADFNGDGVTDVFIGRGGVKGKLDEVSVDVTDELMINENGTFKNIIDTTLLSKGNCPGRQSSWVDFNSDGLLDLYTSCGRSSLPGYPNRLYTRADTESFSKNASSQNLDFDKISVFRWVDGDSDRDLDLLAIERNNLIHYVNSNGKFESNLLAKNLVENYVQLVLVDIDLDNDFDAIAVSRTQSKVLVNEGSTFTVTSTSEFGLPAGGRSISIVDYDNDGSQEIHAIPGGIYKREDKGRFVQTGLLSSGLGIDKITRAICNWFDIDNNGNLDLVCPHEFFYAKPIRWWNKLIDKKAPSRYWETYALRNISKSGNWIQIDLVGKTGNKEAIGAEIEILSQGKTQRLAVGQFDSAQYSQGHYRIYAGLNTLSVIDKITVDWPDGQTTELTDVAVNQLLTINQ